MATSSDGYLMFVDIPATPRRATIVEHPNRQIECFNDRFFVSTRDNSGG